MINSQNERLDFLQACNFGILPKGDFHIFAFNEIRNWQ